MIASITGASGFIGSHLADTLLEKGYTVRALVRKTSNLRWLKDKPIELVDGGLTNKASLAELVRGADYVFHLAGLVKARNWDEYYQANVQATADLIEATLAEAPALKRFMYISSQTAAGPASSLDRPTREDDQPNPLTRYGKSKILAEELVRSHTVKLPYTIVRPPAVFGPRDTEIYLYFKALQSGLNSVMGFDDKRLSLIHSADLVRGIVMAAEAEKALNETYFISSEEFYSWDQVGKICGEALGRKFFTFRMPHSMLYVIAAFAQFFSAIAGKAATLNIEKAKDFTQRYWICDTSKATRDFGYHQQLTIEEALRDTIEWYKRAGWLK